MIKVIIFDCFGVVMRDGLDALLDEIHATDEQRAAVEELIFVISKGGFSREQAMARLSQVLKLDQHYIDEKLAGAESVDQRVLEFANSLRSKYKVVMLSNVESGDGLRSRFKIGELDANFDMVFASGDMGLAKPEPGAYETVADTFGVRYDECLMIDDREPYCEGARAVGMQALQFQTLDKLQNDLRALGLLSMRRPKLK